MQEDLTNTLTIKTFDRNRYCCVMKINDITAVIVEAAYRLHTKFGPGMLESVVLLIITRIRSTLDFEMIALRASSDPL